MQLKAHHEAQEQVGFADRILISKNDLVSESETTALTERLRSLNPRAPIKHVHFGKTDIADILDVRGFNLDDILAIEPDFLEDNHHEHDEDISSFVFRDKKPFIMEKLDTFLGGIVEIYGTDMLRYKGVLNVQGNDKRVVFQGVHMLMASDLGKPWENAERESVLVFIGRHLPKDVFEAGLTTCLVK
jgi:G3E family GTPase